MSQEASTNIDIDADSAEGLLKEALPYLDSSNSLDMTGEDLKARIERYLAENAQKP